MHFTKKFKVRKNQPELDFVNVDLSKDTRLFIDPYAISQRRDLWSIECHTLIRGFFQLIVDNIRSGQLQRAKDLLSFFKEPNETRLGFSSGKPMGAGIGNQQATQLFNAIKDSSAVKTGFISSLEECELMIEGISRDKISDLTTNIIRKKLEEYTIDQCNLHNVAVGQVAVAPYFSIEEEGWVNDYYNLPVSDSKPVLLVPKSIVRYSMDYDSGEYYNQYIINYLQAEHIRAGSSLAKTLKSGQKTVYKKDVKEKHPFSKKFLYEFSKENPKVLEKYREDLKLKESNNDPDKQPDPEDFATGQFLIETIGKIPPGNETASMYHDFMIGALEYIFHPYLIYPKKEQEIHDGRKRIDIVFENAAKEGIFYRLNEHRKIFCPFLFFECKNYSNDPKNPEFDQLTGRFSTTRGKVGFLCCRTSIDEDTLIKRCKDSFVDGRGLLIHIDDGRLLELLEIRKANDKKELDKLLTFYFNQVSL